MEFAQSLIRWISITALFCSVLHGQQPQTVPAVVPRLVNFSARAADAHGKAISGVVGATFAIYEEQYGGAALWLETQNVQADTKGNYTAQLGATKPGGLPLELFASGGARWLGITLNGGSEQPRILLLSVPYALKAADAETVGGLPPSAFILATPPPSPAAESPSGAAANVGSSLPPPASAVTTSGGTINTLPLFTTATNIQNSAISQTGTGSTSKIGINTTTPGSTLDVNGSANVRGTLALPATGTATSSAGKNSQPELFTASVFNSSTSSAVPQKFQWQAEAANNNSTTASGTFNLLFASGTARPAETGLQINNKGLLSFAKGQIFPGTGSVSSVALSAPSSDFTVSGSPVTSTGTLSLSWNVPPTSVNVANAIVKRDQFGGISVGPMTAASINTGVISTSGIDSVSGSSSPAVFGTNGNGGIGLYGAGSTGVSGFGSPAIYGAASIPGGYAVQGDTGDAYAGVFENTSDNYAALYAYNGASGLPFYAITQTFAYCYIDGGGNLNCSGSKNAIVPLDGGKRKVAMSAIEAPVNWFEDAGSARLVNGSAVVSLDADFMQTVNTDLEYHVFLTPRGDCKGLYIGQQTHAAFEVHELGGGNSSIRFDYRIMALRKNYEKVRFADHSKDPDPRKVREQMTRARATRTAIPIAMKSPSEKPN